MAKNLECDRCRYYAHSLYLVCAVHPAGPVGDRCQDFESAELWEPEDPQCYQDHPLNDLFWHPLFTGKCPECRHRFSRFRMPPKKWRCPECDWTEDEDDWF